MSQCILAILLFLATGAFGLFILSLIPCFGIFILAAILSDELSIFAKTIIVLLLCILIGIVGFFDFHIFGYTKECWEVIWNYMVG